MNNSIGEVWDVVAKSFRYNSFKAVGNFTGEYTLVDWETILNEKDEPVAIRTIYNSEEGDVRIGGFALYNALVLPKTELKEGALVAIDGKKVDNIYNAAELSTKEGKRLHQLMKDNDRKLP